MIITLNRKQARYLTKIKFNGKKWKKGDLVVGFAGRMANKESLMCKLMELSKRKEK